MHFYNQNGVSASIMLCDAYIYIYLLYYRIRQLTLYIVVYVDLSKQYTERGYDASKYVSKERYNNHAKSCN